METTDKAGASGCDFPPGSASADVSSTLNLHTFIIQQLNTWADWRDHR